MDSRKIQLLDTVHLKGHQEWHIFGIYDKIIIPGEAVLENLRQVSRESCRTFTVEHYSHNHDYIYQFLLQTTNLTILNLEHSSRFFRDQLMEVIASSCSQLLSLSCKGLSGITDVGVSLVAQRCRQLTSLNLSGTKTGDCGVRDICEHCKVLQHLFLANCSRVSDEAVRLLSECSTLHLVTWHFSTHRFAYINPSSIAPVLVHSQAILTNLLLTNVVPNLVLMIADNCPNLTSLDLSHSMAPCNSVFVKLTKGCPKLKHFVTVGCELDPVLVADSLAQHSPDIQSVHMSHNYFYYSANINSKILLNNLLTKSFRTAHTVHFVLKGIFVAKDARVEQCLGTMDTLPFLKELTLNKFFSECYPVYGMMRSILVDLSCEFLESLTLNETSWNDKYTLRYILKRNTHLKTLSLIHCSNLTSGGIVNAVRQGTNHSLVHLHLIDMYEVTEVTIQLLLWLERLTLLHLRGCSRAKTDWVKETARHVSELWLEM